MSPPDWRAGNEKISEAKSKSDRNIIFLSKMTLPGIEPGVEKMGTKTDSFPCKSKKRAAVSCPADQKIKITCLNLQHSLKLHQP